MANTDLCEEKIKAEVAKLVSETGQIKLNMLLAPFLAAAAVIGATAAATAALINIFGQ